MKTEQVFGNPDSVYIDDKGVTHILVKVIDRKPETKLCNMCSLASVRPSIVSGSSINNCLTATHRTCATRIDYVYQLTPIKTESVIKEFTDSRGRIHELITPKDILSTEYCNHCSIRPLCGPTISCEDYTHIKCGDDEIWQLKSKPMEYKEEILIHERKTFVLTPDGHCKDCYFSDTGGICYGYPDARCGPSGMHWKIKETITEPTTMEEILEYEGKEYVHAGDTGCMGCYFDGMFCPGNVDCTGVHHYTGKNYQPKSPSLPDIPQLEILTQNWIQYELVRTGSDDEECDRCCFTNTECPKGDCSNGQNCAGNGKYYRLYSVSTEPLKPKRKPRAKVEIPKPVPIIIPLKEITKNYQDMNYTLTRTTLLCSACAFHKYPICVDVIGHDCERYPNHIWILNT